MNFRDTNPDSTEQKYISKRVMINGQFVTLYSLNGQTWLSSPEDIPALMERLENARVTLNTAEKVAEAESPQVAKPEAKEKKETAEPPERALSAKYRVKGPKPRPILRQDGVVIKGTPIEPISASSTVMSFSSDVKDEAEVANPSKSGKAEGARRQKLIAPVAPKKSIKAALQAAAAPSKGGAKGAPKSAATPVLKSTPQVAPSKGKAPAKGTQSARKPKEVLKTTTPKAVTAKRPVAKASAKQPASKAGKAVTKRSAKTASGPKRSASKPKKSKR